MRTNKIHIISIKALIGTIIFIGFGVSFITGGKLFTRGTENWIQTTGTITEIDYDTRAKTSYVIVTYYVDPEGYITNRGDVYMSSYQEYMSVPIKYNPSNHKEFTMVVGANIIDIPFTIVGSLIITVAVGMFAATIVKGISAKKQLLATNKQLDLNYIPNFMLEYVPLKAENEETYKFKQQIIDFSNYEVTDSTGKVIFYTKRIKKGLMASATYQLIDSTTKQTTVVNIKKSSSAGKYTNGGLKIKVDNLTIDKYFELRHVTYNISKEGNDTKYTLFNNGSTLGYIYERNNQANNFDIETAKENIDDLSLFALCLTIK